MTPLRRVLELGPSAQPIVAGLYVWIVTVAPAGYGKQGAAHTQNWAATVFATLAFGTLLRATVVEAFGRGDAAKLERSRALTLPSFAVASLVTWICNEDALSPVRLGAARGFAGMLGWALFAYACAAPVVEPALEPTRVEAGPRARGVVLRGDAIFVVAATVLVLGLQVFGWSVDVPERAMLVRLTTLGGGVLLLGGVGAFISTRHGGRALAEASPKARIRISKPPMPLGWIIALLLLIAAGVLYVLTN